MAIENIDYEDLKKRGFLKQRQDGFVILRTRTTGGVYKKEQLKKLSEIAEKYGEGIIHPTTRQGLEIPFVKAQDAAAAEKELKDAGIAPGMSGPCVRAVTSCPGNNWCRFGLINTFGFAEKIEKDLGIKCGMGLPHKFKIAVSGCPNACTRPQSSDIGVHGQIDASSPDKRAGYVVYAGGSAGRNPRSGIKIDKIFTEDETLSLIDKVIKFYKASAKPRQRLALLIEEIGKDKFLKEVVV